MGAIDQSDQYKILVKFASRSRPHKFFKCLDNIYEKAARQECIYLLVSLDSDDYSMYNNEVINKLKYQLNKWQGRMVVKFGLSKSKVDAINRDVNDFSEHWDILVNFSDDMVFTHAGWDEIIRRKFKQIYPDTNGNIFFNDGFVGDKVSTMSIIGRVWYDGNGKHIYHPSYKSLWCDNEYTELARSQNKMAYFDEIIYKHMHPLNAGGEIDEQLQKSESYYEEDYQNYLERRKHGFYN